MMENMPHKTSLMDINATWIPCSRFATDQSAITSQRLLATVIQSTLFAGPFFLPDSAYVNNRLLRQSMRSNETLRQLVANGRLQIARRQVNGIVMNLGDVCHEIDNNGGRSPSFPRKEFLDASDLQFIDECCVDLSYSVADAELQYSNDVLGLLRDEEAAIQAGLDDRIRRAIMIAAEEQFESNGSLKHSFFVSDKGLKSILERVFPGEHLWSKYQQIIRDFTKGPHITCMTNLFRVNPIFAPEHKKSIDLWRRRHLQQLRIEHVHDFKCRIGLATFVRGLLTLTTDDLSELLESNERRDYLNAARSLTVAGARKNELIAAFVAFRHRIERQILKRLSDAESAAESGTLRVGVLERIKSGSVTTGTEVLGVVAEASIPFFQQLKTMWTIITSTVTYKGPALVRTPAEFHDSFEKVNTEKAIATVEEEEKSQRIGKIKTDISFQERDNMDMQIDLEI
jgi:hypothetical protein